MTPSRLYRLAGLAGLACALLLVINAARRGGLLPDGAFLNAIAPLGALTGLLALTGVYLWQRVPSGVFGLVGFALNFAGLAGAMDLLGWEFHLDLTVVQSSQIGFFGIAVALLGRNSSIGIAFSALLFGALLNGTSTRTLARRSSMVSSCESDSCRTAAALCSSENTASARRSSITGPATSASK